MSTQLLDSNIEKFIEKTKHYKVPTGAVRWYVRRVEDYIKASSDVDLTCHSKKHVEDYLKQLGRNSRLSDWQFKQAIDALRILFVDIIRPQWANAFPWQFWIESSTQLPNSHATVARDYVPLANDKKITAVKPDHSFSSKSGDSDQRLIIKTRALFPDHFSRLISLIRTKQYSIRTEQAYVGWFSRFIVFHGMRDPADLNGGSIRKFLEYLVVERHVSGSTQSQALCALVFFYKQVLGVDLGEFGPVTLSKKPRRLPVVLSTTEVTRLFSNIDNPT